MQRDLGLCRRIMLQIEAHPKPYDVPLDLEAPREMIAYQVEKLVEEGLVHGEDRSTPERYDWAAHRLTAAGHDLIELGRSEAAWNYALEALSNKETGMTVALMRKILDDYADFKLGS